MQYYVDLNRIELNDVNCIHSSGMVDHILNSPNVFYCNIFLQFCEYFDDLNLVWLLHFGYFIVRLVS